jgi:hypothetical protein
VSEFVTEQEVGGCCSEMTDQQSATSKRPWLSAVAPTDEAICELGTALLEEDWAAAPAADAQEFFRCLPCFTAPCTAPTCKNNGGSTTEEDVVRNKQKRTTKKKKK